MLRTNAEFPFCSERCRLIDLGKWASGAYVVSTPVFDPDAESGDAPRLPAAQEYPQTSDDAVQRRKS